MSVPRRSLRARWAVGSVPSLFLAVALAPSAARAAPSARLAYVRDAGAESCPDEEGLRRAVAARLGYDPFFVWAKVTVVAHVRKDAGAYHAEVTLVDEGGVSRGQRAVTSQGDDCAPLVGALALTISLALDPLSLAPGPTASEAPPVAPPVPSAPPPSAPPASPTSPASPASPALPSPPEPALPPSPDTVAPTWKGWAGIAVLGSYGTTPGVAFGGALRGKVERGTLSLALEARADAPTAASAPSGGSVRAWLAQATLLGCGRVAIVVGCGLVSGGPLVASGLGLAVPRTAIVAYGAAGPRLGVEWPLGTRFRLEGFAQVAFALTRRALQVDGRDAYREPVAAFSLGAGVSARIF